MKLLIVDDDYQIREGIRYAVDWKKLQIEQVETEANGLQALEMVKNHMPDLILADIQMPGMTGLEMIREVRKLQTDSRVIFISAYSEFDYCREALLLGAADYILKPIQMKTLEQMICKHVEELKKEREKAAQHQKESLRQECHLIYETGEEKDGKGIRQLMAGKYPFLKEDYLITAVVLPVYGINMDQRARYNEMPQENEKIMKQIHTALAEAAGNCDDILILPSMSESVVVLVKGSNSALETVYYQNSLKKVLEMAQTILAGQEIEIISGISASHDIKALPEGFRQGREAAELYFYYPERFVFLSAEACFREHIPVVAAKYIQALGQNAEGRKDPAVIKKMIIALQDCLLKNPVKNQTLRQELSRLVWKNEKIDRMFYETFVRSCKNADTLFAYLKLLEEYYISAAGINTGVEPDLHVSHGIRLALSYIDENYSKPIGVSDAAKIAGMSPNHFSSQFKKEVGTVLTDYVTKLRMDKARSLALYSNMKVNEIGEAVGFSGYMYFSRIFRQTYGCSVSEMRSKGDQEKKIRKREENTEI